MFNIFRRHHEIIAPISGKVLDLAETPDPVFAEKMAGDGIVIESTGDLVVAPADGKLTLIFKTNHAFGMMLDNGVEVLVHIGIDTIELAGEGFERLIEEGKNVKSGDPIIRINRKFIEEKGYSLFTPVLITDSSAIKEIEYNIGKEVEAGKDKVLSYKKS